ncbi:hypothetical protein ACNKHK_17565 [Shigella flexneri]
MPTEQLNNENSEFGEMIGRSEAMYSVLKQVEMVAQAPAPPRFWVRRERVKS